MADNKKPDWNAIRAEYIAGGISQRKLAKKYGVSENTLIKRANSEGWAEQRNGAYNAATTEIQHRTAAAAADNATLAAELKNRLLQRLIRIEQKFPADATEIRTSKANNTAVFKLRDLTGAYRDIIGNAVKEDDETTIKKLDELLEVAWNAAHTETG